MPLPIAISSTRRRWWGEQRRTWRRALPQSWTDIGNARQRRRLFTLALAGGDAALPLAARHTLRLPRWAWQAMRPEEVAAIAGALAWMLPHADCGPDQPFDYFDHDGRRYYLPKANGENLACIEYPLADEFFQAYTLKNSGGDFESPPEYADDLLRLVATLCRTREADPELRIRRDDQRRPLYSRAEALAEADRLRGLHPAHQAHVLFWFAGMKAYVHRTYKGWLFEEPEDEEEEAPPAPPGGGESALPNFGWWGVYQDVAEAGAFGTGIDAVLQAPFHDVCVWLVRQRVKAEEMRGAAGGISGDRLRDADGADED